MDEIKEEHLAFVQSLKEEHKAELAKVNVYNPNVNPKAISIIEQEDGNWKGWTQKFGKVVEVREGKPEDCLIKLITHNGNV